MDTSPISVLIVIPTYNEAPYIARTIAALISAFQTATDLQLRIIIADNTSTDGTADAVRALQLSNVTVYPLTEKGKGGAVRVVLGAATEKVVGFTDADLSIDPESIIAAYCMIANGGADVVVGSRFSKESNMLERDWRRTFSSWLFNTLARFIVGVRYTTDTQCPLKVMNQRGLLVMRQTKETGRFLDLEFIAFVERLEIRLRELPVKWIEHRYVERKSKVGLFDIARAIAAMIRVRMRITGGLTVLQNILAQQHK